MECWQQSLLGDGNCTRTIPLDLFFKILFLLPPKSLIRCQSVSKLWFSTIRSKLFVDMFMARSKARPRLLLSIGRQGSDFIFSAPEHDNNDNEKSSTVMARYEMTNLEPGYYLASGSVNGFVCLVRDAPRPRVCSPIIVYNPTTRQIVKLPEAVTSSRIKNMYARLGYDPVDDQYKVLCVVMARCKPKNSQPKYFVCTVSSSQKQEWRKIENTTEGHYRCVYGETCIGGALYYGAKSGIFKFNVRAEKIEFIKTPPESCISRTYHHSTLINYKGKLGGVDYHCKENSMTLWVLEDEEKQEWSSMTCDLPSTWNDLLGPYVRSKGVSHMGELMVFYPRLKPSKPFYVCYYDFNKKSIRKVEIQGMVDGDFRRIHGIGELTDMGILYFTAHIENIRFL